MDESSEAGPGSWRMQLPNMLTSLRVVLACVFFVMLSVWSYSSSPRASGTGIDWMLLGAAGVFVLAAVTDALDGALARRWGAVSVFGRVMDPFADKLLVIGAFVFMAAPAFWAPYASGGGRQVSGVAAWMVAVILGRELLVTSIRGAMEGAGVAFAAEWSGKVKMVLQSIVVPLVLVLVATTVVVRAPGAEKPWAAIVIDVAVWATVIATVWSGLPYVMRAMSAARGLNAKKGSAGA